jgi:hypothetical protein
MACSSAVSQDIPGGSWPVPSSFLPASLAGKLGFCATSGKSALAGPVFGENAGFSEFLPS